VREDKIELHTHHGEREVMGDERRLGLFFVFCFFVFCFFVFACAKTNTGTNWLTKDEQE
jgi:hypothetical protein